MKIFGQIIIYYEVSCTRQLKKRIRRNDCVGCRQLPYRVFGYPGGYGFERWYDEEGI